MASISVVFGSNQARDSFVSHMKSYGSITTSAVTLNSVPGAQLVSDQEILEVLEQVVDAGSPKAVAAAAQS